MQYRWVNSLEFILILKVIRKRAAQFIRQRLPEMTLGQLMNVVYPLSMLERDNKRCKD